MDEMERKRALLIEAAPSLAPALYSFFRRLGVDAPTAEDLAQDTFLLAWQNAARLHGQRQLRGWLYGIAYRRYLQHRDRATAEKTVALTEDRVPTVPGPGSDAALRAQLVRDALATLPEKYAAPLVLVYWQELSYLEAARALSLPVGTLAWRVHQALKLLKTALAEKGWDDELAFPKSSEDRGPASVCEE